MRKPRILALILLALIVPSLVWSQKLEDKVREFTLSNGMKFIIVERPVAPVFFAAIAFDVGSYSEWDGVTGISHLLEHMMFKGTRTVGAVNYAKEKKYLKKEDEIAGAIAQLRRGIGPWRLEIYDNFSREMVSSLPEDERQG